jgi:hypothetical protein
MSLVKEFYETSPSARERINDSLRFLEGQIRNETIQRFSEEEMAALDNSL